MNYKFSRRERLGLYYIELDRLENQLTSELAVELASKRRAIKPSRTTRYKISILKRTVKSIEDLENLHADAYYNWAVAKDDIQREIDNLQAEKKDLQLKVEDYKTQVESGQGLNYNTITTIAMRFTEANQELVSVKKQIDTLVKDMIRHEKKKPPYAAFVSKAKIYAEMAGDNSHNLPEALESIAKTALGSIDSGDFILPSTESAVDTVISDKDQLYPDVSFMFKDFKPTETEKE